jgi:hypothetical protein
MIIAVIVLALLLAAVVGTLIPMLYRTRQALAHRGATPELGEALARERRRAEMAEAELKVVRARLTTVEAEQAQLPPAAT